LSADPEPYFADAGSLKNEPDDSEPAVIIPEDANTAFEIDPLTSTSIQGLWITFIREPNFALRLVHLSSFFQVYLPQPQVLLAFSMFL